MAFCGIDLGGTKCLGVVVDGGEVVDQVVVATPSGTEAVLAALVGVVDALGGPSALEGVGVGAPGLVDRTGALRVAPNLAVEPGLELRALLEDRLGLRVVVENDATCAVWGERQSGAARGFDDVVLVTLGTGIGGGIIVGGRVHRGANGFAGEVGHMVVDPRGPQCPCGQRGCWERFASGNGLGRLGREAAGAGAGASRMVELAGGDIAAVRGEHVTAALAEGDAQAIEVMGRFAWWTALGLVNLANIFDPQAFVLGGGLAKVGDPFLVPTRAAFHELLMGADWRPTARIVAPELGHRAGAIGAAGLASGS